MAENEITAADYIRRGILIGGAAGAIAAMLGFSQNIFWGTGLGMISGLLAGVTIGKRVEKRRMEQQIANSTRGAGNQINAVDADTAATGSTGNGKKSKHNTNKKDEV